MCDGRDVLIYKAFCLDVAQGRISGQPKETTTRGAHGGEEVGWLLALFYGVSTLFGSFNAELDFKQFSLV